MDILATLSSSCAPFTLSNLDQIVAFSPTDLQKGLQTLKDVQATIAAGLTIQDIQDRSQQDPPRHRRKRLQINADHISRHWASFKDWSAERLHRLLLCPTPDVEFVVGNNNGRKCLQSLIKGMPVSAEFLKILGTIVTTTAPLYESLKHMPDSQPQVANNYLSLAIPQKRNIALVAGSDIDIERKRRDLGNLHVPSDSLDTPGFGSSDDVYAGMWINSIPIEDIFDLNPLVPTQDGYTAE